MNVEVELVFPSLFWMHVEGVSIWQLAMETGEPGPVIAEARDLSNPGYRRVHVLDCIGEQGADV